jgi:hypothetical protein
MHFVEGGNGERMCERTMFNEKYSLHRKAMFEKNVFLTTTAPIKR